MQEALKGKGVFSLSLMWIRFCSGGLSLVPCLGQRDWYQLAVIFLYAIYIF